MLVKIKRISDLVPIPEYQSKGASGFDFHAYMTIPVILEPRDIGIIPTGLYFEIPKGYELQVRSRSGLAADWGIMVLNSPGTVDSDYRGEVKIILINLGENKIKIEPGDRIAQGVISKVHIADFTEVEVLKETIRATNGFGSTGLN